MVFLAVLCGLKSSAAQTWGHLSAGVVDCRVGFAAALCPELWASLQPFGEQSFGCKRCEFRRSRHAHGKLSLKRASAGVAWQSLLADHFAAVAYEQAEREQHQCLQNVLCVYMYSDRFVSFRMLASLI